MIYIFLLKKKKCLSNLFNKLVCNNVYIISNYDNNNNNISKKLRRDASDALHSKQTLEQQRFDLLFGSLEQINQAFAQSYAELSRDGEADLRYSREQLTLFKVCNSLIRCLLLLIHGGKRGGYVT
jgi:hypothetical protein